MNQSTGFILLGSREADGIAIDEDSAPVRQAAHH